MKLYLPPMKRGEDQSKNPFTSNAFFANRGSQLVETMDNSNPSRYFDGEKGYQSRNATHMQRQYQQHNSAGDGVAFGLGMEHQINRVGINNRRHSENAF